jgi:hypothetical protein
MPGPIDEVRRGLSPAVRAREREVGRLHGRASGSIKGNVKRNISPIELKPCEGSRGIQPLLLRRLRVESMFPIPKGPLSELADQREAVGGFVFLVLLFPPSWKRCSERPGARQGHGERRGNAPRAVA